MQRSQASSDWRRRDDTAPAPRPSTTRAAPRAGNAQAVTNRLYVGNLPYEAQKDDIAALFANNGLAVYDHSLLSDMSHTRLACTMILTST